MQRRGKQDPDAFIATKYRNYLEARPCADCGAPSPPKRMRCDRCREGRKAVAAALKPKAG